MTSSRTESMRSMKVLLASLALAVGLGTTAASAAPAFAPLGSASQVEIMPAQYWGDHGGWGHRRHHDGPRYGGYGRGHHDGWGHRRHHGWGHHRGWGHRHHDHHRGYGRYDY